MDIVFLGQIVAGCGQHKELGLPGLSELDNAPDDWPESLHPGSLNILISLSNVPEILNSLGSGRYIQKLDNGFLKPEFVIEQHLIKNNTIGPNEKDKKRGHAQVWRAIIEAIKTSQKHACWVLRILDSGMWQHIEIVSEKYLRKQLGLADGDFVNVSLYGELTI